MKLIIIYMTAFLIHASASSYAQRITLKSNNITLRKAFSEIRKQTGYIVLIESELLNKTKPVKLDLNNIPLEDALKAMLDGQYLKFSIKDNSIVVKEREKPIIVQKIIDYFASIDVYGRIVDEKDQPLIGATVSVLNGNKTAVTNATGYFTLLNVDEKAIIEVRFLGYQSKQFTARQQGPIVIKLEPITSKLEQVNIVSTGYQNVAKERTTGSFEKIDNQLFNRTTGTDVISRLNSTVPGLYTNVGTGVSSRLTNRAALINIRGLSSLTANRPLIILDNMPYEGDINNINPNDIEDVTLLKDAAAASIWGVRAGNGVVVFRTKSGKYNQPLQISMNSNVTITEKTDLSYMPLISSSDFIDVEKFLFGKGRYDDRLNTTYPYAPFVTPVVDLLAKQRALPQNDIQGRAAIDAQIDAFRNYDVRDDFEKYFYRKMVRQQYALNLNGGSNQVKYFLSAGFDKNLNELVTSENDRKTLKSNIEFTPFKNLTLETGIAYTQYRNLDAGNEYPVAYGKGLLSSIYPYARFADDQGNPLPIGTYYSMGYLTNLKSTTTLMDWFYRPLQDIKESYYRDNSSDMLLNAAAKYQVLSGLSAEIRYQYQSVLSKYEQLYRPNSYFVRDLTNFYTNPYTNVSPVPSGGIFGTGNTDFSTQTYRFLLNYNKTWNQKHELTTIAGTEARKYFTLTNVQKLLYGYNEETKTFINVDTKKEDYIVYFEDIAQLPDYPEINDNAQRYTSLYANAAYNYDKRFTLSASARKDASNVFGDNINKNGSPTWSLGSAWNISNEKFWKVAALPLLKIKATYGYSGNVNTNAPAYTVVTYSSPLITTYPFATATNPPNPDLRWEKVGMLNLGIDFALKNNRMWGSVEYYDKRSTDLITQSPVDPTKGFQTQSYNTATIHGTGVDLTLNSQNKLIGDLNWNSNLIFTYNKNIVTNLLLKRSSSTYTDRSNLINPLEGYDLYSLFAYPSVGLDPQTGDPRGLLNGQISKDYTALINPNRPISDLVYVGSSRPRYFGAFRNRLSYKRFELSMNILYKFGYHFKRNGISYNALFFANTGHSEFANRWQKPGDENLTTVPSMVYPVDNNRDFFYNATEAVIQRGDHIRLQDITGSYTFGNIKGLRNLKLYANVSNLGILWRANKLGLDPDITSGYRIPRMIAFGINTTF